MKMTLRPVAQDGSGMPSDGVIESQLVWSRDGLSWHHADEARTPAIPRSVAGFDHGMIIGTAKVAMIVLSNHLCTALHIILFRETL